LEAWLCSPAADADPMQAPDALEPLFAALADTAPAPDADLPDTGVGLALERALSPPFVRGGDYGTRCSSVVLVGARHALFAERRFGPDGVRLGEGRAVIPLQAPCRPRASRRRYCELAMQRSGTSPSRPCSQPLGRRSAMVPPMQAR